MAELQKILFDKKFWCHITATRWLSKYGMKPIGDVENTILSLRYTLKDPSKYKRFETRVATEHMIVVLGYK